MQCDESALRDLIHRYLRGEYSLGEFRHGFVELTPGFDWDPDTPLGGLLGAVELLFAENSSGDLGEHGLRNELDSLLPVGTV